MQKNQWNYRLPSVYFRIKQVIKEILEKDILHQVQKPGQYLGLEWGAHRKDWDSAKSRMAIIYPDLYELGMSNFGIKILYNIVNQHPDFLCDRAYAPMPDMEDLMNQFKLPLWGWETYKPLGEFDFLGFSLAYELCYTNIFTILDLAKIPFYASDRTEEHPFIFAGGPAVFNPEPMANFFDFFLVGDGEENIIEIQEVLCRRKEDLKNGSIDRAEVLFDLAQLPGVYVPQFYEPDPNENYLPKPKNIRSIHPSLNTSTHLPYPVPKRITQNLNDYSNPTNGPVAHIQTIQDKQVLEIRRGCDRGCRFCQVGYTYLPVRERSPENLLELSKKSVEESGYDDFTMLSLSASDYTCLTEAAKAINDEHSENGLALSMPSQRADRFALELTSEITGARKSGMTFAPEAGTEKMRKIINKGLTQDDIYKAIKGSFQEGWSHIKLYFMIGLPFEEDEDLDGILDILSWANNMSRELRKENPKRYKKQLKLTCTISTFVPKSFTAFQWYPQCTRAEFQRKQDYLKQGLYERGLHKIVKLNCTEPELAAIESVLSRGDRRWGEVLKSLWESGSRMDSWSENFNIDRWQKAATEHGFDIDHEISKHREPGSKQAWDVLTIGFTENFLKHEWQQAVDQAETLACTENKCHACGVCFNLDVKNLVTVKQTDINPFVAELDREKRQSACASGGGEEVKMRGSEEDLTSNNNQPVVVVKNTVSAQKLRLKITKTGDLKYIGHLDFQRLFERAIRRTGLPVVHTTGYNQHIKVSWATALPLFLESAGEYIELDLAKKYEDLAKIKEILNQELPKQARIISVEEVLQGDSLNINKVSETVYLAKLITETGAVASETSNLSLSNQLIDQFLAREEISIKRLSKDRRGREKEKIIDLKDKIVSMKLIDNLNLELTVKGTQKPTDILNEFLPASHWNCIKQRSILENTEAQKEELLCAN